MATKVGTRKAEKRLRAAAAPPRPVPSRPAPEWEKQLDKVGKSHVRDVLSSFGDWKVGVNRFYFANGNTARLICLTGNMQVFDKNSRPEFGSGETPAQLVGLEVWLPKTYPQEPPIVIVLAPRTGHVKAASYFKPGSREVDLTKIYGWNERRSALVEFLAVLASLMTAHPAVFVGTCPSDSQLHRSSTTPRTHTRSQDSVRRSASVGSSVPLEHEQRRALVHHVGTKAFTILNTMSTFNYKYLEELVTQLSSLELEGERLKSGSKERAKNLAEERKGFEVRMEYMLCADDQLKKEVGKLSWLEKRIGSVDIYNREGIELKFPALINQMYESRCDDLARRDVRSVLEDALVTEKISYDQFSKASNRVSREQFYARATWRKTSMTAMGQL
mmetsp:Transcript_12280/g.37471  ORF Transcript_12280/g.37471 Transcript_12280/m.37471 type:complete len:388 (+) Transcript_12280:104-1267(+)